ncbi:hypothetical protein LEN26_008921 [Aphanomyces euteiches]|nr:hypothetical protein AeMF1_013820 [Aphanomyces euteiches]KAH9130034.1 hypothetical protein LEN26_008921 [Aphanomyces euteiches]KAH9194513.1 hypothetical protein AeNC1_003516 [Aphanomyces euteiches]
MEEELVKSTVRGVFEDATAIQVDDMDVGVLSRVFQVTVSFEDRPSRVLVAKCPRPEFPFLHSMFSVETAFYTQTKHDGIPFLLPTLIHASSEIVVLDRVDHVVRYASKDGCPAERVVPVLRTLGRMHGHYWGQSFPRLAQIPGIGVNLSAEAKQTQFASLFQPFLDELNDVSLAAKVAPLCQQLCLGQVLTFIHNTVETWEHKSLLHGDFHVANMLFDASSDDKIWLVDWATSGASNPLRDVAFFFIVGVTTNVRRVVECEAMGAYFKALNTSDVSLDDIWHMYRLCLVNQFVILVVYNALTMSLTKQGSSAEKQEALRQGFLETNRRASAAFLDAFPHLVETLASK